VLRELPAIEHERLLVGISAADDGGVYLVDDQRALIQTVDFFTPVVDDPYTFGRIAAANALSDVYAMGGRPLTALNIVCFPFSTLEPGVLTEILRGGLERLDAADCLLAGGHTVDDVELKYGLSVTGEVHPARMLTNAGARPGEVLVLTKPLGTGVITTAARADAADEADLAAACACMVGLNRESAALAVEHGARACTDITGFGLVGHGHRMAAESGVALRIEAAAVPLLPGVPRYIEQDMLPGGGHATEEATRAVVTYSPAVPEGLRPAFVDPQTSGGLLICAPEDRARDLVNALAEADGAISPAIIGRVTDGAPGHIEFV